MSYCSAANALTQMVTAFKQKTDSPDLDLSDYDAEVCEVAILKLVNKYDKSLNKSGDHAENMEKALRLFTSTAELIGNQNNPHKSLVESRLTGSGWLCSIYRLGGNFQKNPHVSKCVKLVEGYTTFQKNPEGPKLANLVANDAKLVAKVAKLMANLVVKYDANLALSPSSH
ncbi:hypothetical protein TNCV_1135981 [Trichonephila clavipes]|nr:hypothetical protein TNCV_1135981 [Trichonephila clavipes]